MTLSIEQNKNLQALNTLATPAVADSYCAPQGEAALEEAIDYARSRQLPVTVLGEGSNVVLADRVAGLVLHTCSLGREVLAEDAERVTLAVAAGENWHSFVSWCLQQGYHGLENLALIPGTVGAAPIQNIGAYGVEVEHFILRVDCRDLATGKRCSLQREECNFGYRHSIFKAELRERMLVETVVFRLPRRIAPVLDYPSLATYLGKHGIEAASPRQVFDAVVAIRSLRLPDPEQVPNVGSFFKNPLLGAEALKSLQEKLPDIPHYPRGNDRYAIPAAYLIDASNIAAQLSGPVCLHPEHSLVIINPARASASVVRRVAGQIVTAVAHQFAITLEQEPRDYG